MSNNSGITPVEYKCLVLPEKVEEKTQGGILLSAKLQEQDQLSETRCQLIALGGMAFEDWKDGQLPQAGDRVMIAKYSGILCRGNDGEEYRVINDKDIIAIISPEVKP